MRIIFCRSKSWVGRLIQLATFSKWNHVALENNGIVYEADMKGGVRMLYLKDFKAMWTETASLEVEVSLQGRREIVRFMHQQMGKPYDFMAILALPFRTNWQSPHRWFCSELVAKALAVGGLKEFLLEKSRVTPRDLWVVAPWITRQDDDAYLTEVTGG